MKPSHQTRLPVSKPDFGDRQRRARAMGKLNAHSGSTATNDSDPSSVDSGVAQFSLESNNPKPSSVESSFANAVSLLRISETREIADSVRIQVASDDDRPFELGDLLTRKWVARNSSFLVSLGVHMVLFLILSAVLLHGTGKAMIVLELLSSPDIEERTGVTVEVDLDGESIEDLGDSDVSGFDVLPGLDAGIKLAEGEVAEVTNQSGAGGLGVARGDGKSAKFFGTRATGNSFVFMLDCSGSMGGYNSPMLPNGQRDPVTRFAIAKNELMTSIESLRPNQEFYVVLFSNTMWRMNDDDSLVPSMLKATHENKSRVRDWLEEFPIAGGTDPRQSVKFALKMKPDAVFMLSDGDFTDERNGDLPTSAEIVRKHVNANKAIKINSIAFEDERSKKNMAELAAVSGGDFRFVKLAEFRDGLINSPFQATRLLAIEELAAKPTMKWSDRQSCAVETLIPLLGNESRDIRLKAETLLSELSFKIFDDKIKSVARTENPEDWKQAIEDWTAVWNSADQLDENEDIWSDSGFFRALSSGMEDLDFEGGTHLTSLEKIDLDSRSPGELVELARKILAYQKKFEGKPVKNSFLRDETFLDILAKLNQGPTSGLNILQFSSDASYKEYKSRFDKVLIGRNRKGQSLMRGWRNKNFSDEKRTTKLTRLLEEFPETHSAIEARKELEDLQASQQEISE